MTLNDLDDSVFGFAKDILGLSQDDPLPEKNEVLTPDQEKRFHKRLQDMIDS